MHIITKNDIPLSLEWFWSSRMSMQTLKQSDLENFDKICLDYINDMDTIIGMENDWHDYLFVYYHVAVPDESKVIETIKQSLMPCIRKSYVNAFEIEMFQTYYNCNATLYVVIDGDQVIISTKDIINHWEY